MTEAYRNVDIPLDVADAPTTRRVVQLVPKGTRVAAVYIARQNFTDDPVPAGAQVRLFIGDGNDEILLGNDVTGFEFGECGHDGGLYFNNGAALAGKVLRLLVDFGGLGVRYAS
jgi:hypothetical protein